MNYCVRSDIETIYGKRNVAAWSNLDNTEQALTDVSNRIAWACTLATDYVNSRLVNGPYSIPFAQDGVPITLVHITAMQAGIYLYDGRQVVSAMDNDQVTRQRLEVMKLIRQILRGQLKLLHPTTGERLELTAYIAPFFVAGEDDGEDDTNDEPTYY